MWSETGFDIIMFYLIFYLIFIFVFLHVAVMSGTSISTKRDPATRSTGFYSALCGYLHSKVLIHVVFYYTNINSNCPFFILTFKLEICIVAIFYRSVSSNI